LKYGLAKSCAVSPVVGTKAYDLHGNLDGSGVVAVVILGINDLKDVSKGINVKATKCPSRPSLRN